MTWRGASKRAWRDWARRVRAELDLAVISADLVEHLAAWPPLRGAATALTYLPTEAEVDLTALTERLPEVRFVVTRTAPGGSLTLHPLDVPLERHPFGFLQPVAGSPTVAPEEVEVALVPGLAFDRRGVRMGYGKGYFDRFLAELPASVRVGVVPARLLVERLPEDTHDIRMTHLATEEGVRISES